MCGGSREYCTDYMKVSDQLMNIFFLFFFIREWLILTFTSGKARLHFSFL